MSENKGYLTFKSGVKDRVSDTKKNTNKKQWYKDKINNIILSFQDLNDIDNANKGYNNHKLYNGDYNEKNFTHIINPYKELGKAKLPLNFMYKSILAPKLKVLEGIESARPFDMTVIAVNPEATTLREEEQFGKIKDFTISSIKQVVQQKVAQQYQQQLEQPMSNEDKAKLQQEMQQVEEKMTPDRVAEYVKTEFQAPSEILANRLLNYFEKKDNLEDLFSDGWKDVLIDAREVYYVGQSNDRPLIYKINTYDFEHNGSGFITNATKAVARYYLEPVEVVGRWSDELTDKQIDSIYKSTYSDSSNVYWRNEEFVQLNKNYNKTLVYHVQFISLKKVGFLITVDENNEPKVVIVNDQYKLAPRLGDVDIVWQWIKQTYEGFRIEADDDPIYVGLGEVNWETVDEDNIFDAKLSFIGADYDSLDGKRISLLERGTSSEFMYNIIQIQIQKIIANDKGKILAVDPKALTSKKINLSQALYFMEANGLLNVNSAEFSRGSAGVTDSIKVLDLSTASDLGKYMNLLEFYRASCGQDVGVTPQMEGSIQASENVGNVKQAIAQNTYMIEPHLRIHERVKRDVLQMYLDVIKNIYANKPPQKLSFIMDDLSKHTLELNPELFSNSQLGVFVSNSSRAAAAQQMLQGIVHAAMQNQQIQMSAAYKMEVEASPSKKLAILEAAEEKQQKFMQEMEQQKSQNAQALQKAAEDAEMNKLAAIHEYKLEEIKAQGEIDLNKQAMLSLGFSEDKDANNNGIPDSLDVLKQAKKELMDNKKLDLEERKFEHKKKMDKKNNNKTNKK